MKTLIFDANYFCYRSHYSRGAAELVFDDERTDIIFGFLSDVLDIGTYFRTNQFVFCWDHKISKRKEYYPEYKNRNKNRTEKEIEDLREAYKQFDLLRIKILPQIGFMNNICFEGYEADDHIAKIVLSDKGIDPVICSTDHDLYQLLEHAPIYNPSKKEMYTIGSFREKFGLEPDLWSTIKSCAGCTSDNIIGLVNVGEKGVASYLRGDLKPTTKKYKVIEEGIDAITKQNLPLVQLPLPGTPKFKLQSNKSFKESYAGFINVARKYGFNSFLNKDNLYLWRNLLDGFGISEAVKIAERISRKRKLNIM